MKPLVLVTAPIATRSGYGSHSRDIVHSLLDMNKFDVHFAVPNDFNFKDSTIIDIARDYREVYNTDLTKISALGFDIASYIINYYLLHNSGVFHGVMGDIEMVQKGEGNGFENSSVWIMHQQDFELFKVEDDK